LRTWPLGLALADAAAFALTLPRLGLDGEGDWTAAVAGAVSAIVAVGIFPGWPRDLPRPGRSGSVTDERHCHGRVLAIAAGAAEI